MPQLTRRQFLLGTTSLIAAAGISKFAWLKPSPPIPGSIIGASSAIGHKLREGIFPAITAHTKTKLVIIGAGIAGLSAAWKLHNSGFHDFILLELEKDVGGNASYGENAVSAYPWGAHYVPLLAEESTAARELFRDLGIITGEQNGQPVYNEYFLSADPHERLFMYGRWQEGIVPQLGITERDKEQYHAFFRTMEQFKTARGKDGRKAFAIPLDKSSADPDMRKLDTITATEYLNQHGWDSPHLHWYVNYCCRDDYGATANDVSAWAAIHYFAGRSGKAANADSGSVITWPEGNGWIVKQLKAKLSPYIRTNTLAFRVTRDGATKVHTLSTTDNTATEIETANVLFATPRFIAERLLATGMDMTPFHYSPWMVANITLDTLPHGKGAPLSWDNMVYDSKMLGYVVATHQNLNRIQNETVLTYYWPLSHLQPKQAREEMFKRSYEEWRDIVLQELWRIHPELKTHVKHLDVWLWGHGMIRPSPGFIWGKPRQAALRQTPPFFYAHSDMSGVSIFEEANHHGVQAAESLMAHLHHPFRSSL